MVGLVVLIEHLILVGLAVLEVPVELVTLEEQVALIG